MNSKGELTAVSLKMPKELHKKLKLMAVLTGKSMSELMITALESWQNCLGSDHIPNKKTVQAIKNVTDNKDVIEAQSIEDLLKKAGL